MVLKKSNSKESDEELYYKKLQFTTVLHAVKCERFDALECLVDHGADVNLENKAGTTALAWACASGQTKMVQALIKLGADVNYANKVGKTALIMCVVYYRSGVSCPELLLDNNAAVNLVDNYGMSALMYACQYGHSNLVKLLLDDGADFNAADQTLWTPLIWAAACDNHKDGQECAALLIKQGANLNATTTMERTALMTACMSDSHGVARILLEENEGMNALMFACKYGAINTIRQLLQMGAFHSITNKNGRTALGWAARRGYTDCAKMLIEHGANPNFVDNV
eukprot:gene2590-5063_t